MRKLHRGKQPGGLWLLSLFLLIATITGGLSLPAIAAERIDQSSPLPIKSSTVTTTPNQGTAVAAVSTPISGVTSTSRGQDTSGHFYRKQLNTPQERQLYSALESQIFSPNREVRTSSIRFTEPIFLDPSIFITDNVAISRAATLKLQRALDAFRFDHPEMYWVTGGSVISDIGVGKTDSGQVVILSAVGAYQAQGSDFQSDDRMIASTINDIINRASKEQGDYNRLKKVHDLLAARISYEDFSPIPKRAHQITGGLVDRRGVCETYAKSFKLITEKMGYETILAVGIGISRGQETPHMWNYIKVAGQWYAVDITWNDQSQIISDYFLAGLYTTAPNLGGRTFGSTHIENYQFYPANYESFYYPNVSRTAYKPSGQSTTPTVPTPPITQPPVPIPETSVVEGAPVQIPSGGNGQNLTSNEILTAIQSYVGPEPTVVKARNQAAITTEIITQINQQTQGSRDFVLAVDTVNYDLGRVEGRFYLTKEVFNKLTRGMKLGIVTDPAKVARLKEGFETYYSNQVRVAAFEEKGTLSTRVEIALYLDLGGMDSANLHLYVQDAQTNRLVPLENNNYRIDSKGYVRFHTAVVGNIYITEGPLVSK